MMLSLLLSFLATFTFAMDFVVWKPTAKHPGVLLPREEGLTPEQAVERYWERVESNPELAELLLKSGYRRKAGTAEKISLFSRQKPIAVLLANDFSDYTMKSGDRTKILSQMLSKQGYDVFVVGLAATTNLSRRDAAEFRTVISHQAEMLFALGGDDVSAKLYNEKTIHARETNMARDKEEVRLIYDFKRAEKGFFIGICRGHQLGAITDGHTLFQDLEKNGVTDHSRHRTDRHGVHWNSIAKAIFPAQTLSTAVNSLHHQAVRVAVHGKSKVIGTSTDGVVEALAMNNGKGISFQFHPEYMAAGEFGANYAQVQAGRGFLFTAFGLEKQTRQARSQLCRQVYR